MPTESPFKLSDVDRDDIILVKAPHNDTTKWTFNVHGADGAWVSNVWVARVTANNLLKVTEGVETYKVFGYFAWNTQRDLTQPITFDDAVTSIEMEEDQLYGVYDWEEDFKLSNANMKALLKIIRKME